jgi:hypothetical protein
MNASSQSAHDSRQSKGAPKTASVARGERKRSWLRRHGCSELVAAFDAAEVSLRKSIELAHLPPSKQRQALANERERLASQLAAANAINGLLATSDIDLDEVASAIRNAIHRLSERHSG